MKTVKHLSVLLAILMVFSLAAACFTVNAEEVIPEFDPCITQAGPGAATTLGSISFSAFVSARENEAGDKIDYRFLLVADIDTFLTTQNAKLVINFAKGGQVVKTLTKDVMTELDIFAEVKALRSTYVAFETSLLTGIIVTDVPKDGWDNVTVKLVDDNGAIAGGSVEASTVKVEGYNGTLMDPNHINFYFSLEGKEEPKTKAIVYWFDDKFGGSTTVSNIGNGTYTADLTINGVEYKNVVVNAVGRYLVMPVEASGITGLKKGETYKFFLAVNDLDGNRVYYTQEFEVNNTLFDA